MEPYFTKSIIAEIAKGIEKLISTQCISKESSVILYGLDRYSFAMRTILSNLGYNRVEGYLSDDWAQVAQHKAEIENFACRYLNGGRDIIPLWTLEERLLPFDDTVRILLVSRCPEKEAAKLEALGYREGRQFFIVYDFQEKELDNFLDKMTRMSLAEAKIAEKELLFHVDQFCRENHIRYWVCGGTLLGTIRHKGFIPWDDDIDIFMPWQDYLRFIALFGETQRYGVIGFGAAGDRRTPGPFIKVVDKQTAMDVDTGTIREISNLFIDVFPLVGMPEDAGERHRFFMEYQELDRQIWQEFYAANGDIRIFSQWIDRQREFMERFDFDNALFAGVLGTIYKEKDCTSRKVFDQTIRMPFEDMMVNVFAGYKEYLENHYGRHWMELPDEEQRKSHHEIAFYR